MEHVIQGNRSFRSYSRSDPGSYSLLVRLFRPGSFRPDFRAGSFRPNFGGFLRPTLFYLAFKVVICFFLASLVDFKQFL